MSTISERIRQFRLARGLSQQKLADSIGITQATLSQWESGLYNPSLENIEKLSSILGVSIEALFGPINIKVEVFPGTKGRRAGYSGALQKIEDIPAVSPTSPQPIAVYEIADGGTGYPVPTWCGLACGHGSELSLSESPVRIIDPPPGEVCAVIVHGDSMLPTIKPRDIVVLKRIINEGEPVVLPPLDGRARVNIDNIQQWIKSGRIFVISINDEPITLKRVWIARGKRPMWHLIVTADNPETYGFPYVVGRDDKVIVYAQLVGFGARKVVDSTRKRRSKSAKRDETT